MPKDIAAQVRQLTNEDTDKFPAIVLVGVGGGGSRILSEGLYKTERNRHIDRYTCLSKAIAQEQEISHTFIVDTSSDPATPGFYRNIPKPHKISLSGSIKGMSRGAGGKPGRATKAVLNTEVARILAEQLYKPIADISPAIVVFIHTADGGTGGGLTPELLHQLAYVLPMSTVFWVFTVLPQQSALSLKGPRTVGPNIGKMLDVIRRVCDRKYDRIPFQCREAIRAVVPVGRKDRSDEFKFSRIAMFPMSNHHFAKCWTGGGSASGGQEAKAGKGGKRRGRVQIREEVLNPFPIEVLSQALYPYLKYKIADEEQQQWMQHFWPMGPIDIPDIMAGVTPERPVIVPHLLIDPELDDEAATNQVIENLRTGHISLEKTEGDVESGLPESFSFIGTPTELSEFRASALYCVPIYPEGSPYFDSFGDQVSDIWFPMLSGSLNYIGGRRGDKVGVISHSANLKPQPIPKPKEQTLGFDDGLLVTLIFGAVPPDFVVWLDATKKIVDDHKTQEKWELSYYDANTWLSNLADYVGWPEWPKPKKERKR